MLKANPQGDGIGDVAFRRGLGHDSGALMNGVSAHIRDLRQLPPCLCQ